jgi:hypothetical protein
MAASNGQFIAYQVSEWRDMRLTAAEVDRDWMEATDKRFAYRCLPLVIANQSGWVIANPTDFTATWDGGPTVDNLRIDFEAPGSRPQGYANIITFGITMPVVKRDPRILSHFGSGILTFSVPYLFRTPPGINLWVKGPTNYFKDGIQPLEGVVETDWSAFTFTMNWKFTRPDFPVRFQKGEPICMVVPMPRGLAESLEPLQTPVENNPELQQEYLYWQRSRDQFNLNLRHNEPAAVQKGWQREYVKGLNPSGKRAQEHQTRLSLQEFKVVEKLANPEPLNSPQANQE